MLIQLKIEIELLGWAAAVLLRGPFSPIGKGWGSGKAQSAHVCKTLWKWKLLRSTESCSCNYGKEKSVEPRNTSGSLVDSNWGLWVKCRVHIGNNNSRLSTGDLSTVECFRKSEVLGVFAGRVAIWDGQMLYLGHVLCSSLRWQESVCALWREEKLLWISANLVRTREWTWSAKVGI